MLQDVQALADLARRLDARWENLLARLLEGLDHLPHGHLESHSQRDDAADRGAIRQVKPTAYGLADVIFHLLQRARREQAPETPSGQR